MIMKLITATLDLKSKDIQDGLNISKSVISRHFTGEKENMDVINGHFGIIRFEKM